MRADLRMSTQHQHGFSVNCPRRSRYGERMNSLDNLDWELLGVLQHDARLGFRELARRTGLSPATVASRVRRMENTGVIAGYHARVDPRAAGYGVTAFIVVDTNDRRESLRVAELAARTSSVLEDHRVTGSYDHVLKVAVEDLGDLEPVIDELNEFGRPATTIVLSSPKPWSRLERPDAGHRSAGPD